MQHGRDPCPSCGRPDARCAGRHASWKLRKGDRNETRACCSMGGVEWQECYPINDQGPKNGEQDSVAAVKPSSGVGSRLHKPLSGLWRQDCVFCSRYLFGATVAINRYCIWGFTSLAAKSGDAHGSSVLTVSV